MPRPTKMKAALCTAYGEPEVVRLGEVSVPELKPDGVLIRIQAATVSSGDWRIRSLQVPPGFGPIVRLVFGLTRPRQPILGTDCAGVVEAVGANVTNVRVGERVVAFPDARMGCHAQFTAISASGLILPIPESLGFSEATALCFGGLTALHFLNKAQVTKGQRVLVLGGSGSVGTMLVQLAALRGAHVTATCSAANADLVHSLGAEQVIDYQTQNIFSGTEKFDRVLDTTGTVTRREGVRLLKPGGRLVLIVAGLGDTLGSLFSRGQVIAGPASSTREMLQELVHLAEKQLLKPVIDRVYLLEQIVEAHRHVGTGRKKGNVVVTWWD